MKSFTQNKQSDNTTLLKQGKRLTVFEMTLFSMFGAMMFISKIIMEFLPNVHLLAMFTVLLTVVYRKKALIPIYIYVLLNGVYAGFAMWWIPYLYIWTLLWGAVMLLPRNMSKKAQMIVYPVVCCAHGALFGVLYAPAQALMYSLSFDAMIAWILAGLPYDAMHAVGDLVSGMLIYPLARVLITLNTKFNKT